MTTTNPNRPSSNEPSKELKSTQSKNLQGVDARPAAFSSTANANPPVRAVDHLIYGDDDRKDIYEIIKSNILSSSEKEAILTDADSVVAILSVLPLNKITRSPDGTEVIIDDEDGAISGKRNSKISFPEETQIVDLGDGTRTLFRNFGTAHNLSNTEPFRDQPICSLGGGSGFLVAPDVVATAAHCVFSKEIEDIQFKRFVFGFRALNNDPMSSIKNFEVYRAIEVIGKKFYDERGTDWALVRLDRPVINHRIAPIRHNGKVLDNQPIHVIGHPVTLPLKYADGATVQQNTNDLFFLCNSDTYKGNSGSPLFNSQTHVVEGVLSVGDSDFVPITDENGQAIQGSKRSDNWYGKEGCTRTTEFAKVLTSKVWSGFKPIPGLIGTENQGGDIAVTYLNGNNKPDLIVFHVQNPEGENKAYYQIGRDLNEKGDVTGGWSPFIQVPGRFGADTEGAGIAVSHNNGRHDLVVFHIEKNSAGNRGFYRIGCDLDAKGNVTKGWTQPIEIKGRLGTSNQGAGIAVTDLNGNGKSDLIVFFIDNPTAENPKSENRGYYRIGYDLKADNEFSRWSEFIRVPKEFGAETQGAGVAIETINGVRCLIVFYLDHPTGKEKGNQGCYYIGWNLGYDGTVKSWSEKRVLPGLFGHENQGAGITTALLNSNTHPHMIVYRIDNPIGGNKGYYRTGWILP